MPFVVFYRKYYFLLLFFTALLLLSISFSAKAQISADTTSGCAPLRVQFKGISGSTGILWDFKDGVTSEEIYPNHSFSSPGIYNVNYTATVAGASVNQSISVQVFGKPTPSFIATTPTQGCNPLTVSFEDKSTGGGGTTITKWSWTFGDGGGDSLSKTPTYKFTRPGKTDVTLTVRDANRCDSTLKISKMVATSVAPKAVITTTPNSTNGCTIPFTVKFSGLSSSSDSTSGSTKLTYLWDFADSTYTADSTYSKVAATPAVIYTKKGSYSVNLTVADNNNCSAKASRSVFIDSLLASFSVNDTVCKTVTFINSSSAGTSLFWNYGDGTTGGSSTHTYVSSGIYKVKLTATSGSCSDDTTRTIVVEDPKADFSYTPSYFCSLPGAVTFTDSSTDANTYSWLFSKGSDPAINQYAIFPDSSSQQNPSVAITYIDTNQYTINKEVLFLNATLAVTSSHGCTSTKSKALIDTVFLPTARFVPDTTLGCAPLKIDFADSSLSKEKIINWRYEFGDGTIANLNTKGDTSHTYTIPGTYHPILIIENSNGCIDTSFSIAIYVGDPPVIDFSVSPTSVCLGEPVQFTNLISSSDSVDTWHYSTDGGLFMSSCPEDPNPRWSYKNSTGLQDVTLTACWNGCCSSLTKSGLVNVKGPLVNLTVRMNCDTPYTYIFTADVQDADKWVMDFGDNDSVVTTSQKVFSHTYSARGDYVATLTAYNSNTGCSSFKDSIQIKVRDIRAGITSDTIICPKDTITFSTHIAQDVDPKCNGGYIWIFGDGSGPKITNNSQVSHPYSNAGKYIATLIVVDDNGCRDTARQAIRVYGITPAFTTSHTYFCIDDTIHFINKTIADTTISDYQWKFGDGITGASTLLQPDISHLYTNASANSFTIELTANSVLGCSDKYNRTIYRSRPSAAFAAITKTTICAGNSVKFQPGTTNHTSYSWIFGDGTDTSNLVIPTHTYTKEGNYTVLLSVVDSIGCKQSERGTLVQVQDYPQAGFTSSFDTKTDHCYVFDCDFKDTTHFIGTREWNLGISGWNYISTSNVKETYERPGDYKITLIVKTTYGCSDTLSKTFRVDGPLADFTVSKTAICKGDTITFEIKDTVDLFSYSWDFGDGFDTTAISPVSHQYNFHPPTGTTNAELLFDASNHSCPKSVKKQISIHQVIADFDRNKELTKQDTAHCIGIPDLFTNKSKGADRWTWNFGDGTSSTSSGNQNHQYSSAGEYIVSLNISDKKTGCADTLQKPMIIFPIPITTATGGDTCVEKSFQLHATGGTKYIWTPGASLDNDTIPDPMATPAVSTTYSVIVTDSNECSQSNSAFVFIEQKPQRFEWDTTIVIGMSAQLNAYAGSFPSYLWTPDEALSCTTCYNPVANPLHDVKYIVTISDTSGCFAIDSYFDVYVLPLSSVDVPSAFTPNGDGINDIVYVDGWGIKRLIEFRIYNRWGELIFETEDLKQGWDGTFKGVPQNIETYVYQVKAETYVKGIETLKGYIKLFR